MAVVIMVLITLNFNLMWLTLYGLAIRRGFLDRTYGIPMVALSANFAWDVYNTFWKRVRMPAPQPAIDFVYMLIDLVIIYQLIRYWRNDMKGLGTRQFYFFFGLILVFTFLIMRALIIDLNDVPTWHAAFIDTFINSALFIVMFYNRPNLEGQSLYIGLCKLVGTAPFMLLLYFAPQLGVNDVVRVPQNEILPVLWIGIFVLDLVYVVLFYRRCRELRVNPWRRF